MNNWNTMISHAVSKMTESDFEEAVVQWAEGSTELEQLLRLCHEKNIPTTGCHVGSDWGYVDFLVDDISRNYLRNMMNAIEETRKVQVLFSTDGGNPFSGEIWYQSQFGIVCELPLFQTLIDTISFPKEETSVFEKMLTFYEILVNKRLFMYVRMRRFLGGCYLISFEFTQYSDNPRILYLKEFFKSLGFVDNGDSGFISMEYTNISVDEFLKKLVEIEQALRFSFSPPYFFEEKCFEEQCTKILDEQGIDVANKYIEEARAKRDSKRAEAAK